MLSLRSLRSNLWLYLSLLAVCLVWLLFDQLNALRPLRNLEEDLRFRLRGPIEAPVNLVYVDIDTKAINQLGSFPWDRAIFARACELLLTRGGAKAVGIDVVFSEAGVPNLVDRARLDEGHFYFGRYLLRGISPYADAKPSAKQVPNVVLAASYAGGVQTDLQTGEARARPLPEVIHGPGEDAPEMPEWDFGGIIYSPPLVGVIDTKDGETRRVPIYAPVKGRNYLHMALELSRLSLGLAPEDVKIGRDRIDLVSPTAGVLRSIPLNQQQWVDINWFSPWVDDARNRRVSIADITQLAQVAASGNAKGLKEVDEYFADDYFKDAVVLIGPVDPLLQDLAPTPFDRVPAPKVSVHGNMVKTLLSGRFIRRPPEWMTPVITLGLSALVVGLFLVVEGRRNALWRGLAIVILIGYVVGGHWVFSHFDLLLPMIVPVGAALSATFIGGAAQLVLEQKQKSRIKGLFGAYLAPSVVAQMVDSGQEPTLGGVEENITAYFSDIESFSSFSEVLSPKQLVELMNEYLTACTDIVQAQGGTLDKYIGDALVAMYGAPLALPNHAHHACVAALRVQRRCGELREKWRHEAASKGWPDIVFRLRTRVGLNTGRAVVGNMGSASRFSYTMMGDTVNLAARMESGAKAWGVITMCADATWRECRAVAPDAVVFRPLGRVVVKGRKAPEPIFELVGLPEDVTDRTRECLARFEAGLAKYYAQDWVGALADFEASAALEPNQPESGSAKSEGYNPSLVYQQRVRAMQARPPGPGWDGAFVMDSK